MPHILLLAPRHVLPAGRATAPAEPVPDARCARGRAEARAGPRPVPSGSRRPPPTREGGHRDPTRGCRRRGSSPFRPPPRTRSRHGRARSGRRSSPDAGAFPLRRPRRRGVSGVLFERRRDRVLAVGEGPRRVDEEPERGRRSGESRCGAAARRPFGPPLHARDERGSGERKCVEPRRRPDDRGAGWLPEDPDPHALALVELLERRVGEGARVIGRRTPAGEGGQRILARGERQLGGERSDEKPGEERRGDPSGDARAHQGDAFVGHPATGAEPATARRAAAG